MGEFKRRCLYRSTNSVGLNGPEMFESMWAYTIKYPGTDHRTPGRYRIRITKMTGSDFMALMGQEVEEHEVVIDYSMQAFVEKWGSDGWIQCLDWIGDPDSSMRDIEKDLNEMFQAFTTGEPVGSDFHGSMGPPGPPRPSPIKPRKNAQEPPKPPKPEPDFDWI